MKRRKFDKEFKEETVRLVTERKRSIKDVAESIGIHPALLSKWKRDVLDKGAYAFPGNGNMYEDEISRLRREVKELKEERDILKKATVFFARNQ